MTWANYDDVVAQIQSAGFDLADVEIGARKRVKVANLSQKGWYSLHEITLDDGRPAIIGSYGWWVGAEKFVEKIRLRVDKADVKLDSEKRTAITKRLAEDRRRAEATRKAEADRASRHASSVWRAYIADGESDYLTRKRVAAHGLRFSPSGSGTVAVPMMDASGKIHGLQLIRGKNRQKRQLEKEFFPRGLVLTGHYHLIGGVPVGIVLIAEGYATAATLHQSTGLPVVIAFTAGNLMPVAEAIHKTYRGAHILVCADDDYLTAGNPGVAAAKNAALAVGGHVAVPAFTAERPTDHKGPTDFNDLAALEGEAIVRAQIEATLRDLEWSVSAPRAAKFASRGEGSRAEIPSIVQIDEALERFAMIYGAGGTWFDDHEHILVPKADLQDILPEHGMRDMRTRKRVVRLDEVGFDPAGADPRIRCNLWGGWPTTPRQGNCTVLLELLEYLCSAEENPRDIFQWVVKWLAYPIQHPGAKMRTALVFHGPQGTGKNLFFEQAMAIYGEYGRIIDQNAIEDKFNDWASRKLFMIADEVVARAELFHVKNKLKGLVTGEWIRINPKNVAAHDERNHVNLVFLSNESQPLVLEKDDRRYTVIWTPDKLAENFYAEVKAELDAGGVAALHHHLLNVDLDGFDEHTKPPMTDAKRALIEVSLDSVDRFVTDWLEGAITFAEELGPLPFCPCGSTDLYAAYQRWCKLQGVPKPRELNQFMGTVARRSGWFKGYKDRYEDLNSSRKKRQRVVVPSDVDLTAAAKSRDPSAGIRTDYRRSAAENIVNWVTESFFAFKNALGGQS